LIGIRTEYKSGLIESLVSILAVLKVIISITLTTDQLPKRIIPEICRIFEKLWDEDELSLSLILTEFSEYITNCEGYTDILSCCLDLYLYCLEHTNTFKDIIQIQATFNSVFYCSKRLLAILL
jgi:hypothetical protein